MAALLVVAPAAAGTVLLVGHRGLLASPTHPSATESASPEALEPPVLPTDPPSPTISPSPSASDDPSDTPIPAPSSTPPPTSAPTPTPPPAPSVQNPPDSDPEGPVPDGTPAAHTSDGIPQAGALLMGAAATTQHSCSASVVHSTSGDVVLTAAHCVWEDGAVVPYIAFAPGYTDGSAPLGLWLPPDTSHVLVPQQYQDSHNEAYDYAFVVVASQHGKTLEQTVGGGLPLGFDASPPLLMTLTGYPSGTGGSALTCSGPMGTNGVPDGFERFPCTGLPGGTSGSPWVSDATGEQVGLTGGYDAGGDSSDFDNYSVLFGSAMQQLFMLASDM